VLVSFTLPVSDTYDATQMPWLEDGQRSGEMYVVFKSHAEIERSGTSVINYGPVISYTDPFSQVYTHVGNLQTVEVHGAALVVTYTVDAITDTTTGRPGTGVVPGVLNEAAVTVDVFNQGDYIARESRITVTFTSGVTLTASTWPTAAQGADWVAFELGDLAPGGRIQIGLLLEFVAGAVGPWAVGLRPELVEGLLAPPDSYRVIAHTDGRYVHEFPFAALTLRRVIVRDRLAGPLELGAALRICRVFMPTVLRNHGSPWWPWLVDW
jgi:hypothetical protein